MRPEIRIFAPDENGSPGSEKALPFESSRLANEKFWCNPRQSGENMFSSGCQRRYQKSGPFILIRNLSYHSTFRHFLFRVIMLSTQLGISKYGDCICSIRRLFDQRRLPNRSFLIKLESIQIKPCVLDLLSFRKNRIAVERNT